MFSLAQICYNAANTYEILFLNDDLLVDFKNLFRSKGYNQFYRTQIFVLSHWQTWQYDSFKELLLKDYPTGAICIVNPKTKEMVVLPKADISYLAVFLEKYKNW